MNSFSHYEYLALFFIWKGNIGYVYLKHFVVWRILSLLIHKWGRMHVGNISISNIGGNDIKSGYVCVFLTTENLSKCLFVCVTRWYFEQKQSCSVLNNTGVISSKFTNKFVKMCQYYYTLLDQSIPLVAVTSVVSLLTEQLWAKTAFSRK